MNFTQLRGSGSVAFEFNNLAGDGSRITRDFLQQLIKNVIKEYTHYLNETKTFNSYPIMIFKEQQFSGIMSPAIAAITHAYLTQCPCDRKLPGVYINRGHIDYWIYFNNTVFLIELKHAHYYENSDKKINSRFKDAVKQLNAIKEDSYTYFRPNDDVNVIKIALVVIVFEKKIIDMNNISHNINISEFIDKFYKIKDMIEPNFSAIWILNKNLNNKFNYNEKYYQNPVIGFIAHIF